MSKKIVILEGMLKAVDEAIDKARADKANRKMLPEGYRELWPNDIKQITLKAALLWQSENPIVPTHDQAIHLCETFEDKGGSRKVDYCDSIRAVAIEWQRIMLLTPEPEVPEEIKDLLSRSDIHEYHHIEKKRVEDIAVEAYRIGQNSKGIE